MNKREINPNIDFADSFYESFEMINKVLVINIISWDAKQIKIYFQNPIHFTYNVGGFPFGAFEILNDTEILKEALGRYYEILPTDHGFKLYIVEDMDDFPVFEIVADSARIEKMV